MSELDNQLLDTLQRYLASGIEQQIDYEKFYLYSLVTHSTAIEGSTVTEIENQLLFENGIAAKGRSIVEQMMNLDLRDAYLYGFDWIKRGEPFTVALLCQLSAKIMRRTGTAYSTLGGEFDSSQGDLRKCNVSAGVGGRSYLSYQKVPDATKAFCMWLNAEFGKIDVHDIVACYRLSFEAHYRLVTIHPWVDGNGRATRLVMNLIQRRLGLVPSIVAKDDKATYIQALIDSREADDSTIIQNELLSRHIANLEARLAAYTSSL